MASPLSTLRRVLESPDCPCKSDDYTAIVNPEAYTKVIISSNACANPRCMATSRRQHLEMNWPVEIQAEFEKAEQARARGNEGQARVCARRAAGMAARRYFQRRGKAVTTPSAYDLLQALAGDPEIPARVREAASRLTIRVDEAFKLPPEIDLLAEAQVLCERLLPESPS